MRDQALLYVGEALGNYGFPNGHPLSIDRQGAFWREAQKRGLDQRVRIAAPRLASRAEIEQFHDSAHVDWVHANNLGGGMLDYGDTPAFPGVFDAGSAVVGTALDALDRVMAGDALRTFQPIGGLHHARRDGSAGFCVFNDLGVVIESLRGKYGVERIAYVDIDVHHGDGVFYAYEHDPQLIFADIHEDGRYLYPGTGKATETGKGDARGTKLNVPMPPGADDAAFMAAWDAVEAHIKQHQPEIILFQCGADGLDGDPLAHLRYSPATHAHATRRLRSLAETHAQGRLMAFGGGGYDLANLASGWNAVLEALV
jgi:acetoin utilization protein AcuC